MDMLLSFFKEFVNLGAAVMLPFVIFLLGLFFRMKPSQALKSGLLVGVGFQGISLTVSLLTKVIAPVTTYYAALGQGYSVVEVGFAALGGASWAAPFAVFAIPAIVLINIILLRLRITRVLNVDIWNFMHFLVPGALAWVLFDNAIIGFCVAVILSVVTLFVAEWGAKRWGEFFGLEGTACTCLKYIVYEYPMSVVINGVIDKIPGLKNLDIDLEQLSSKLGIFGDPAVIGLIVGAFLGIITQQSLPTILTIAMGLVAVMVLLPRMVSVMMEGLSPLGAGANEFVKAHIDPDTEIFVGMDIALALGDPGCIACTALMIPITVAMALLIPHLSFFPTAVLGEICYMAPMALLASKGNLFRTLLCMCAFTFLMLIFMNMFVPYASAMLAATDPSFAGSQVIASHFGDNPGCIIVEFIAMLLGIK